MTYEVKLEIFEGPLDLLLHLIDRNEVDITDIPISLITNQYLETIELMKSLNLDVAGEYLVMAAYLTHVKSKMLLPTEEIEEEEVIGADPRDELVAHLLEYKRYKEAARVIDSMPLLERDVFTRELDEDQPQLSEEPLEIKLSDLLEAFKSILNRTTRKDLIQLEPERLHIKDKMNLIIDKLTVWKRLTFNLLFEDDLSRVNIVTTFLALLELLRLQIVTIFQDEPYGTILIMKREETESAGNGDAPER